MSALGQLRTWSPGGPKSDITPQTDTESRFSDVHFVPLADMVRLAAKNFSFRKYQDLLPTRKIVERYEVGIVENPGLHVEGGVCQQPHEHPEGAIGFASHGVETGDVVSGQSIVRIDGQRA